MRPRHHRGRRVAISVHYANKAASLRSQWQAESKANKAKLSEYADIVESNRQLVATLGKDVSELNGALADYTNQLATANDKIQAYALAEQNRQREELEQSLASVPKPVLIGKVLMFPKVAGVHNEILATNAAFAYLTGRRLLFRTSDPLPAIFDVDAVHPLVLKYLGIDAAAAKLKKQQSDVAAAAAMQAGAAATAQLERDLQAKQEREAALAIEQEKADAAQRAAWAAQQQADAMMFKALNPTPVNVIQQQVQQVR
jgi:hypothetical protein